VSAELLFVIAGARQVVIVSGGEDDSASGGTAFRWRHGRDEGDGLAKDDRTARDRQRDRLGRLTEVVNIEVALVPLPLNGDPGPSLHEEAPVGGVEINQKPALLQTLGIGSSLEYCPNRCPLSSSEDALRFARSSSGHTARGLDLERTNMVLSTVLHHSCESRLPKRRQFRRLRVTRWFRSGTARFFVRPTRNAINHRSSSKN
jgi:hypothetical protein